MPCPCPPLRAPSTVGEFLAAAFGERLFRRRLERAIAYGLALTLLSSVWFTACLPSPFSASAGAGQASLYCSCALIGLGTGFCYPLYLELAAEITFPAPEGVSSAGVGFM
jgi:hypothetical protein